MEVYRIDRDRDLPPTTNVNNQPVQHQLQPSHPIPKLHRTIPPNRFKTLPHVPISQSQASASIEKLDEDALSVPEFHREPSGYGRENQARLPSDLHRPVKARTMDTHISAGLRSGIDWIVPIEEKSSVIPRRTLSERLQPTLDTAHIERDKYAAKAKMTGYSLNAAIGLQVLLGSLTTSLSIVTTGRQTSIMTAVLGGLSTITASYLARARGSNEPELSITRVKDLEHFIRECHAFQMDFGHITTPEYDDRLNGLRDRFEELLGNGNG
ncbi:hypothetical protein BDZ94DRAFT_1311920 [Collybia nuda]|uniref:SMODS and SLOG-associating 2TM effector domain-containing protein n=1 Tax=Collybia nuda TaxID=64659 RepID=A0A9P6CGF4_9AGAR|nr:hypothetical protein BDZ94DRAFT_1311920 [Collybia nuda]